MTMKNFRKQRFINHTSKIKITAEGILQIRFASIQKLFNDSIPKLILGSSSVD